MKITNCMCDWKTWGGRSVCANLWQHGANPAKTGEESALPLDAMRDPCPGGGNWFHSNPAYACFDHFDATRLALPALAF